MNKPNCLNIKLPHFNIKIITITRIELKISITGIITMCKKCPYSRFFWSVFLRIWTEYGPEKFWIRILFAHHLSLLPRNYMLLNPFYATGLFLYPLKSLKNKRCFDVFRGYIKKPVTLNGLKTKILNQNIPMALKKQSWQNW